MEKDIVELSIPFAAGVAAVVFLPLGTAGAYAAAALSCASSFLLIAIACGRGDRRLAISALFLSTGILCGAGSRLCIHHPLHIVALQDKALGSFCGLLDSIGFREEATGPLVKALLTGRRDSLDPQTVASFRTSGASHILALSGLHLGVIYGILNRALGIFGNSRGAWTARSMVAVSAAAAYTAMTGASPSTVRALLFICFNEILRHQPGRRREPLCILCAALTLQLAVDPQVIASVGFQLSYLAMLGIFLVFPTLESWFPGRRKGPAGRIWTSAALSISCQIFTAPLVWIRFGTFPKYFLLTNLIALPLTEALIVSSVVCTGLAAVGWGPGIMKGPVDFLARTLIFCLDAISSM